MIETKTEWLRLMETETNAARHRRHNVIWNWRDGDLHAISRNGKCIICWKEMEVQVNCRPRTYIPTNLHD